MKSLLVLWAGRWKPHVEINISSSALKSFYWDVKVHCLKGAWLFQEDFRVLNGHILLEQKYYLIMSEDHTVHPVPFWYTSLLTNWIQKGFRALNEQGLFWYLWQTNFNLRLPLKQQITGSCSLLLLWPGAHQSLMNVHVLVSRHFQYSPVPSFLLMRVHSQYQTVW